MKVIILCLCILNVFSQDLNNAYQTKYIDVPLDHFSYTVNNTFKLRYLINDTYYSDRGPIFFYTGNEGDITVFAQNTGFIFDIAPQFNALIVFAEHRYYGTSLPFGNLSYSSPKYLGYLSSSQALSDYVYLINNLQKTYDVSKDLDRLPVIAFGGSYGGMLAAWIRMKYPNSVLGAIASSAPIRQFKDLTPCENFDKIVTDVFKIYGGDKCKQVIQKSWSVIRLKTKNDTGKSNISKLFNICDPLKTEDDVDTFVDWLSEIYTNLAMVNYPYPTSFLKPLPATPVRQFCDKVNNYNVKDDIGSLKAIGEGLQIYTNYTENTKCNDIKKTADNLGEQGWDFQSCTEMIMPMCSNDLDMFENSKWDFKKYSDDCFKKLGVRPRSEDVPILEYGGKNLKYFSNIVFSNGLQDPWSSGGVICNVTSKISAVLIPDGAHHFDLRSSNEKDSRFVIEARLFHVNKIRQWLNSYYLDNLIEN